MTAIELRTTYKGELIGLGILTQSIGNWPGGPARIIELDPDPAAPEIVFNVKNIRGEIGIFDWETIYILEDIE